MPVKHLKNAADRCQSCGSWCVDACRSACSYAAAPFRWTWDQATGFYQNIRDLVDGPGDVLPDPVQETWERIVMSIPQAFGLSGEPQDQVIASVLLAVVAFGSSFVTAGATLVLVAVFAGTALMGLLRMIPAVGDRYDSARSKTGDVTWERR